MYAPLPVPGLSESDRVRADGLGLILGGLRKHQGHAALERRFARAAPPRAAAATERHD